MDHITRLYENPKAGEEPQGYNACLACSRPCVWSLNIERNAQKHKSRTNRKEHMCIGKLAIYNHNIQIYVPGKENSLLEFIISFSCHL